MQAALARDNVDDWIIPSIMVSEERPTAAVPTIKATRPRPTVADADATTQQLTALSEKEDLVIAPSKKKKLTGFEKKAIHLYTTAEYGWINNNLRQFGVKDLRGKTKRDVKR
ncbi:MAG: hypothetical protein SGARI_006517, partial [Bacillariaceae sp.]